MDDTKITVSLVDLTPTSSHPGGSRMITGKPQWEAQITITIMDGNEWTEILRTDFTFHWPLTTRAEAWKAAQVFINDRVG